MPGISTVRNEIAFCTRMHARKHGVVSNHSGHRKGRPASAASGQSYSPSLCIGSAESPGRFGLCHTGKSISFPELTHTHTEQHILTQYLIVLRLSAGIFQYDHNLCVCVSECMCVLERVSVVYECTLVSEHTVYEYIIVFFEGILELIGIHNKIRAFNIPLCVYVSVRACVFVCVTTEMLVLSVIPQRK